MVQTPTNPETLFIELPRTIALQVTLEQFTTCSYYSVTIPLVFIIARLQQMPFP